MKRCCTCKTEKPLSTFNKNKARKDGHADQCKSCAVASVVKYHRTPKGKAAHNKTQSEWQKTAKGKASQKKTDERRQGTRKSIMRYWHVKRKYGLAVEEYDALVESGKCHCCGNPFAGDKEPCIDHDHVTGKVRGVLCGHCNKMIGFAREQSVNLRMGADYIDRTTESNSG